MPQYEFVFINKNMKERKEKQKRPKKIFKVTLRSFDKHPVMGAVHWWDRSRVWLIDMIKPQVWWKLDHTLPAQQANKPTERNPVLDQDHFKKQMPQNNIHIKIID